MSLPAIQILGPTASGKSALAEAAAERFGLDLVSVDSALVYRGLDIGSAKPPPEVRARLRYWLLDLCEPEQPYSAARFVADATAALRQIDAAGRRALLVGGTMLYFRALNDGLSALPEADPALRARLAAEFPPGSEARLHDWLATADPPAAARIRPGDRQRLLRALEVIRLTGRPLSAQQQGPRPDPARAADLRLAYAPADRALLHQRIEQRLAAMFEAGLVDEVRALRARPGLTAEHPAMRAVGYRQVWEWLDGQGSAQDLRDRALYATRQLAKRQYTWLRSERAIEWIDAGAADAQERALRRIAEFLAASGRRFG